MIEILQLFTMYISCKGLEKEQNSQSNFEFSSTRQLHENCKNHCSILHNVPHVAFSLMIWYSATEVHISHSHTPQPSSISHIMFTYFGRIVCCPQLSQIIKANRDNHIMRWLTLNIIYICSLLN